MYIYVHFWAVVGAMTPKWGAIIETLKDRSCTKVAAFKHETKKRVGLNSKLQKLRNCYSFSMPHDTDNKRSTVN